MQAHVVLFVTHNSTVHAHEPRLLIGDVLLLPNVSFNQHCKLSAFREPVTKTAWAFSGTGLDTLPPLFQ